MKQSKTTDLCAPVKQTKGRQKIEIKKIEKKSNQMVTFSKRRMGLFRKASEVSILCGAEIAILVESPANKIYTFGSYSVDSVLERLYGNESAPAPAVDDDDDDDDDDDKIRKINSRKIVYLDAESRLEKEKGIVKSDFWWDRSESDILKLHELEQHVEALEGLESTVFKRVNELKIESLPELIDVDGDEDDDSVYLVEDVEKNDEFSDSAAVVSASNSSPNAMSNGTSCGVVSESTPMDSDISKSNFFADLEEGVYGCDFDDLKHLFDGFVQEHNLDDSGSSFRLDSNFGLFEDYSDWDEFVKCM